MGQEHSKGANWQGFPWPEGMEPPARQSKNLFRRHLRQLGPSATVAERTDTETRVTVSQHTTTVRTITPAQQDTIPDPPPSYESVCGPSETTVPIEEEDPPAAAEALQPERLIDLDPPFQAQPLATPGRRSIAYTIQQQLQRRERELVENEDALATVPGETSLIAQSQAELMFQEHIEEGRSAWEEEALQRPSLRLDGGQGSRHPRSDEHHLPGSYVDSDDELEMLLQDCHAGEGPSIQTINLRTREDPNSPEDDSTALAMLLQREEDEAYAKALQAEEDAQRTCMICTDELPLDDFPFQSPTLLCEHDVNTCNPCLQQWLTSQGETKGWDKVACPECGKLLDHTDMEENADREVFAKYDNAVTVTALSTHPDFRWCLSPTCPSGQIHIPDPENPEFQCHTCDHRHCVTHNIPYHTGETCAQYDYRTSGQQARDEETATEATVARTTKKCPKQGCGVNIEKKEGCDRMVCVRCGTQFCWVCVRVYEREGHAGGCRYSGREYPYEARRAAAAPAVVPAANAVGVQVPR